MDKDSLIKLLSNALQMEYTGVFLYPREVRSIKDKNIASVFEQFGRMEIRHADMLSVKLLELGASPKWEFKLLGDLGSTKEILKRHMELEKGAINLYAALIEQIDQPDLKIILRGIKAEEEAHRDKISQLLSSENEI